MLLTRTDWRKKLSRAANLLKENADMLSKLDSETGDGDHGVTVARMAQVIEEAAREWKEEVSVAAFLEDLGWQLTNINGGSAGPLWGTLIGGMAEGAGGGDTDEEALQSMFASGLEAMDDVTTAKLGNKTLMDALIPACEAVAAGDGSPEALLCNAADAAAVGAEKTKDYVAKFGRAKNLKERAIGHRDPGAVSLSIFLRGLTDAESMA